MFTPYTDKKKLAKVGFLLILVVIVVSLFMYLFIFSSNRNEEFMQTSTDIDIISYPTDYKSFSERIEMYPGSVQKINLNKSDSVEGDVPSFVKIENNRLIISPEKYDIGEYSFQIRDNSALHETTISVEVSLDTFNVEELKLEILEYIGDREDHFGIYFEDVLRNQTLGINEEAIYPPASLSKLPSVILALWEIQEGRYSFNSLIPIQNEYKHVDWDELGKLEDGTLVPLEKYISEAILTSNNTAHYHLHESVLGGLGRVNALSIEVLEIDHFSLNPHEATAADVGKVLKDLYDGAILNDDLRDYLLIDLMQNTPQDLRLGIPAGVPEDVAVSNKVGFLFGGIEGDTYSDSAIVFTESTDYILVVLNDEAPPYPEGANAIREISEIVYRHVEK